MDPLVGFGFYPTDQEIIRLLVEKRRDPSITVHAIYETNIYDFEPPELSRLSTIQSDKKWCNFFCAPKYINAGRKSVYRATKTGYWKLTGEGYPIKDKRSKKVIGYKRVLVFYERPGGPKEIKTDWVMHQFTAADSPLYKKDFVVCRVKKPGNKKRRISTTVGGQQRKKCRISTNSQCQPIQDVAFDNENTSPELQLPTIENTPPELPLSVIENTSPELQLPVIGNTSPELQLPVVGNTFPLFQLLIAENTSPESQQLPSDCSVYNTGHDAVENTLQVDPPHLATFNALNGCNGLVQSSVSAVQSPINPEQESSSSGVSTNDCNGLVSPYSTVWEDIPLNVQDEYTSEEGGDSILPYFQSSKSIPGFFGGDRSETDTEFTEWVHDMFEYNNIASVNYNAILNY
ncbi:NAC domain-containing protein 96-like isoform X2 [Pistacia vera]|uniref:NAC domain-containing protein 96-like isoform X2 n=1 Tax=Pistacia vera TaxID=55513 RepID=UPI0012636039|nr:NAC domain-containing protein 96-like isoform X2 [Pistacia vera]